MRLLPLVLLLVSIDHHDYSPHIFAFSRSILILTQCASRRRNNDFGLQSLAVHWLSYRQLCIHRVRELHGKSAHKIKYHVARAISDDLDRSTSTRTNRTSTPTMQIARPLSHLSMDISDATSARLAKCLRTRTSRRFAQQQIQRS